MMMMMVMNDKWWWYTHIYNNTHNYHIFEYRNLIINQSINYSITYSLQFLLVGIRCILNHIHQQSHKLQQQDLLRTQYPQKRPHKHHRVFIILERTSNRERQKLLHDLTACLEKLFAGRDVNWMLVDADVEGHDELLETVEENGVAGVGFIETTKWNGLIKEWLIDWLMNEWMNEWMNDWLVHK